MKRVYSDQLVEVGRYLSRSNRRNNFPEFQKTVKAEIIRALETPQHVGMINEIFSRADKSSTEPIKTDRKIALKLYKWERSAEGIKKPKPQDVHDIAGVTIVCNYPSDVEEVARFLEKKFESSLVKFTKVSFRDPRKMKGYSAYHAIAKGSGKYTGLTCEVQIKTSLVMSWGAKTHDLTYKPLGDIDARLNEYMEKLANVALILDEQSEILKSLIHDAWEMDEQRRDAARVQLITGINTSSHSEIEKIASFVRDNVDELAVSSLSADMHNFVVDGIVECCESLGHSRDVCRVAALYALCRTYGDRNDWAIELIDDWIEGLEDDSVEQNGALGFRSVASMALGEYEEAIETGRIVVKRAEATKEPAKIAMAKSNLAYFLSEAYFHRAFDESSGAGELIVEGTEACAAEALAILADIDPDDVDEDSKRLRLDDTVGAVMITCSDDEAKIREGLRICEAARRKADGTEWEAAAQSFFSLHEKRAFRRLLAFN